MMADDRVLLRTDAERDVLVRDALQHVLERRRSRIDELHRVGNHGSSKRPALFAGVLQTNLDQHGDLSRTVSTVGAQIDLKVVLFSNLPSMLSFGYANAFDEDGDASDEFMISLKIL